MSKAPKHSKSGTKSGSKSQANPERSESEWCEWYWEPSFQCMVRNRKGSDGKWMFQYDYPEGSATPRTSSMALPEPGGQHASLPGDETLPLGSPRYVAQPTRSYSGSGSQVPERLSPGDYSSSTGPRDKHGSMLTSSDISSFTQQLSQLGPLSGGAGYGQIGYGGVAQQNMGNRPGISPNDGSFQRSYQQSGGYGVGNYASSSYGQNTFASMQPLGDPYYGRSMQPPQSLGNPTMNNSFIPGPTSTLPYQASPAQEQPGQFQTNRRPEGSEHITLNVRGIAGVGLHKDFQVHHSSEFVFGRVFKILWAEPSGQVPRGGNHTGTEKIETEGEQAYATIRRFVIASPRDGHCLCLPILTYGRQATRKHGVKPQDHAIVYIENSRKLKKGEKKKRPTEAEGEEKLLKKPIGIKPLSPRDQLDRHSRLNYAKIYTVEHNLRVCFIGSIHKDSVHYFKRDYNATHNLLPLDPDTQFSDDDKEKEEEGDRAEEEA